MHNCITLRTLRLASSAARKESDEIEAIRAVLIKGENSGFSGRTPEDVKKTVTERLQKNGQLPLK